MKRIYYFELLQRAKYLGRIDDAQPAKFYIHLKDDDDKMRRYDAPTLEELIRKVKADGFVIWGKKIEDYCHSPHSAYEIVLLTAYLKSLGKTDKEIEYFLGNADET